MPQTSTTYHLLALTSDILPDFDETRPAHYQLFNVRSVVAPADRAARLPPWLGLRGSTGRFRIFNTPATGYFDVVDATSAVPVTKENFYAINDGWLKSDGPKRGRTCVALPRFR